MNAQNIDISFSPEELRTLIGKKYDDKQKALFADSQFSLEERFSFADFHLKQAEQLRSELINKTEIEIVRSVLAHDAYFSSAHSHVKAHTVAALQNIHSFSDIIGSMVYFALGLNIEAKNTTSPSLNKVKLKIDSVNFDIKTELDKIYSGDYITLSDLNNKAKHQSIFKM